MNIVEPHGQNPRLRAQVLAFVPQGRTSLRQALQHVSVVPN